VVTDATVDIHQVPGTGSREQVLLLDGYIIPLDIANHITSLHVITTQLEDINHVVLLNQLQNVNKHVLTVLPTEMINGLLTQFTEFHQMYKKSKLKS